MSYDYTIGAPALAIPFPPEGSFTGSREDLCGPVEVTLDDDYDQNVITPGTDQTFIESNDNSLIDASGSPLIIKYRTKLRDFPSYNDGPEYQVRIFLHEFEPYRPDYDDDSEETDDDNRPSMNFSNYPNGAVIVGIAGRA